MSATRYPRSISIGILSAVFSGGVLHAQYVRPSDGLWQMELTHQGLAADSVCKRTAGTANLHPLPGYSPRVLRGAIEGVLTNIGTRTVADPLHRTWQSPGQGHLRVHYAPPDTSGVCGLDLSASVYVAAGSRSAGSIDASYLFSNATVGATRLFATAQASNANTYEAPLRLPTQIGAGASYTTHSFYQFTPLYVVLLPVLGGKDRLDVRARFAVSEDAVRDSTGAALAWRNRPDLAGTTLLFWREIYAGILYAADAHPAIVGAPEVFTQTTSVSIGPFGYFGAFGLVRYSTTRVTGRFMTRQFAIHGGIAAF